jgi:hypothetical protein
MLMHLLLEFLSVSTHNDLYRKYLLKKYPIFLEIVDNFALNKILSISLPLRRILLVIIGNLFYKGE